MESITAYFIYVVNGNRVMSDTLLSACSRSSTTSIFMFSWAAHCTEEVVSPHSRGIT